MSSGSPNRASKKRKRKRRVRSSKRLRFFLLSLGLAGIIMGVGLSGYGLIRHHSRFVMMGLIYVCAFAAVLFVRAAMEQYDVTRHRRQTREGV